MSEREAWLQRTREAALEPELRICDPHHHLWDYPANRYLVDELLAEIDGSGHRVASTVFVECLASHRKDGPEALRPVGETETIERLARESNFPVDRTSCSYAVLWNSFKLATQRYAAAERQALFHDTAARVYRLKDEGAR